CRRRSHAPRPVGRPARGQSTCSSLQRERTRRKRQPKRGNERPKLFSTRTSSVTDQRHFQRLRSGHHERLGVVTLQDPSASIVASRGLITLQRWLSGTHWSLIANQNRRLCDCGLSLRR